MLPEDPTGAQDEEALDQGTDGVLALDLADPVDVLRAVGITDVIRRVAGPGENIVRGDVDHLRADAQRRTHHVERTHGIDGGTDLRLGFSLVHVRIRGAVDDHVRFICPDVGEHILRLCQVEVFLVHPAAGNPARFEQTNHFPAQLAPVTGNENLHGFSLIPQTRGRSREWLLQNRCR